MGAIADAPSMDLESEWESGRRGVINVYVWEGGDRVVALLRLRTDGGTMLLNARLMTSERRQVAVGWAFGVSEHGEDGWHVMYTDGRP